jgi:16S rRNA (cytosine1402-N4)-methyltransferase
MEINEELNEIKVALKSVVPLLNRGARVCMLTYHSVEDRTAKMAMREFEKECICPPELPVCTCGGTHRLVKKIVRKPLLPSAKEVQENSRARSAKLRVYERL